MGGGGGKEVGTRLVDTRTQLAKRVMTRVYFIKLCKQNTSLERFNFNGGTGTGRHASNTYQSKCLHHFSVLTNLSEDSFSHKDISQELSDLVINIEPVKFSSFKVSSRCIRSSYSDSACNNNTTSHQ